MKYLISQRHIIRQNMLSIIAIVLFCYFSFHILMGERSYLKLVQTQSKIEMLNAEYQEIKSARVSLEERVVRMRPGSVDMDLLEERARKVLGYVRENEDVIL